MSKRLTTGNDARVKLGEGLNDLANAVKKTLGPRGRNVAIESDYGIPVITKDGVSVARSISFPDRQKNMGAQIIKSVATNANIMAGDGTTTATVLAQSIYNKGIEKVNMGFNPVLLKRGLDSACQVVCDTLGEFSNKISSIDDIKSVASISANNDTELGSLITDVIDKVGENGAINVGNGSGHKTVVTYSDGFVVDKGYLSNNFINNHEKMRCEFDNPLILIYDGSLTESGDVVPIMTKVSETKRPLLVIAKSIDSDAFQTLILNNARRSIVSCAIKAPGFGDIRRDMLDDIAVYCGAKVFTGDAPHELLEASIDDLGTCDKSVCYQNKTMLIGQSSSQEDIDSRINMIKDILENANEYDLYDHQVSGMIERLSKLAGVVATIKVGGVSEAEQKERKDRVEDSVNAVRAAIKDGIVPGGGSSLLHCIPIVKKEMLSPNLTQEEKMGYEIMIESLKSPFENIMSNAGVDHHFVMHKIINSGNTKMGYDALLLEEKDDMISSGIIDPVKVVITSLSNAVSASGILLTTEAVVTSFKDPE